MKGLIKKIQIRELTLSSKPRACDSLCLKNYSSDFLGMQKKDELIKILSEKLKLSVNFKKNNIF